MSKNVFTRAIVLSALAACLLVMLPAPAAARVHGGVVVGGYWGGYYPYGWGPYGYYPYYGPGYYFGRPMGEVEIKATHPDAQIYLNGAFAGRARDMKHFYLAPGTYDIEQRIGPDVQRERVYVLADHKVKLEFARQAPPAPGAPPAAQPAPAPAPRS